LEELQNIYFQTIAHPSKKVFFGSSRSEKTIGL
jgi:hypothetical protein